MREWTGVTSSPMAELFLGSAKPAWFCVRSHLKHEHIAAAHLENIPDVQVFNPRLRLLRSTRRGRVWSTESLFPNYLFARFVLESKLEKVRYTPSVANVLRFGPTVPAIPDAVIEGLQRDLEGLKSKVLTDAPEEGEEVEVGEGAFKGLTGQVTRVLPARQRVQILLDFMGRSIAAELSLELLLFRRKEAARLALPEAGAGRGPWPKCSGPVRGAATRPLDDLYAGIQAEAA
jgi:transcriptional antiterminator RfaH